MLNEYLLGERYGYDEKILSDKDDQDTCNDKKYSHIEKFIAEFIATFVFLLLGLGATTSSVVSGAQSGIWQSAVVWGIGVSLGVYIAGDISGGHLNPAVSLTMAIMKPKHEFTWLNFAYYSLAQVLGSIVAAFINYGMWKEFIIDFEHKNDIDRGSSGSEVSAMVFCDYFPNVSLYPPNGDYDHLLSPGGAFGIEIVATALLLMFIFAVTDPRNQTALPAPAPIIVGAAVASLISIFGPLTQAGLNPARDFGPRIVASVFGWGTIAFPGPRHEFWLYILGPLCGGPLGALVYNYGVHFKRRKKE